MADGIATEGNVLVLSYDELGERTGRTRNAARQLARRRGWRVISGNDGSHRVAVPASDLRDATATASRRDRDGEDAVAMLVDELRAVREGVATLRDKLDEAQREVANAKLAAAERVREAEVAAAQRVAAELERLLERERRPWWRRWVG